MPDRPTISPDWNEGRFFDRWMYVHLLCGLACGFAPSVLRWSPAVLLTVTAGAMVLWELGEAAFGVAEAWENRVIDVVVGLAGTLVALAVLRRVSTPMGRGLFWATTLVFVIGDVLGWRAYRRRRRLPAGPRESPPPSPV